MAGAAIAAALPHADAQPTTAPSAQQELTRYFDQLSADLSHGPQPQRDEAAQRLVEIGSPATESILLNALVGNDERTQNACARAIAHGRVLDPRWIDPLVQMLGNDRMVDSAAHALARYDSDPPAYEPLIRLARSKQQADRIGIIDAVGQIVQKPVGEALIGIVGDPSEDAEVRSASAEALQNLSGQVALGADPQQWQAWWNARAADNLAVWRTHVLGEQHPTLQRLQSSDRDRLRQLKASMGNLLARQFDRLPAAEKPKMLLSLLSDPNPDVRRAGEDLVSAAVGAGQPIPDEIHTQLMHLIGDAAPDVRIQAVRVLRSLGESNALDPILVQLQVEPNTQVKLDLLQAVAQLGNSKAIPVVEQELSDPSPQVAAEAARTLQSLAKSIRDNPAQAKQVFDELQTLMQNRTGPPGMPNNAPGSTELRAALVGAMAELSGGAPDQAFDLFQRLIDPNEPASVRQAAVKGLPAVGERAGDYIARELDPGNEPNADVRRQAAIALGQLGSFNYAKQLDTASRSRYEPVEAVREAAWKGFQSLLPAASIHDLEGWADSFHREIEPPGGEAIRKEDREIAVRKELASKYQAARDLQDLAIEQQRIGEIYRGMKPPQYGESVQYLQAALNYWQRGQGQALYATQLVDELEDSLLRSGQFREACQFGEQEIARQMSNQDVIGPRIRNYLDELIDQGKNGDPAGYKAASDLVNEALKMSPYPLDPRFQLDEIKKSIPTGQ